MRKLRSCLIVRLTAACGALCMSATGAVASEVCCEPTLFRWGGQGPSDAEPKSEQPLVCDRPDFTECSTTVGAGLTQIEMGYTFIHDRADNTETQSHSYPEALFRIGMFTDWFEWRIAYNHGSQGVTVGGVPFTSDTGAEDLYFGIKLALTEQDGVLPEMALMPQMTVPTGHEAFTAGEVLPGVNWLYGWDVVESISTAGSTQINKAVDEDGSNYYEIAQSWTVGYTFTEHWGGYTEFFALFPSGATTALPEYYFDGGFFFPINNDLQFDVRAGLGLNEPADDFFAGAGMVVRF
jgi:hypothetical protein